MARCSRGAIRWSRVESAIVLSLQYGRLPLREVPHGVASLREYLLSFYGGCMRS